MKHYSHILRFAAVLILVAAAFVAVRAYLVPASFGVYGSYTDGYHRGASDHEQASLPILFRSAEKCRECHQDEFTLWSGAGHAGVTCEACHGPWRAHNSNTPGTMLLSTSDSDCLLCHRTLAARPEGFPQIPDLATHLRSEELDADPDATCTDCHDPHEPI